MAEGFLDWLLMNSVLLGPLMGVVSAILLPADGKWMGLVIGVAWSGSALLLLRRTYRVSGRARVIVFLPSGEINSPLGLAVEGNRPVRWRNTWHEIINFESEQLKPTDKDGLIGYTHGVRGINRDGDVLRIARHLRPDDAHKLAHTLTLAVLNIRSEVAERAPVRQPARRGGFRDLPAREVEDVVIE
ncbi:MAG: hypothetical protein AB7E70_17115 [Hyphomicrobiaceae bacterium]